jgi:hypothetical protein
VVSFTAYTEDILIQFLLICSEVNKTINISEEFISTIFRLVLEQHNYPANGSSEIFQNFGNYLPTYISQ